MIYMDNNATTFMDESTITEMMKWVNVGNPSSSNKSAQKAKRLIEETKTIIRKMSGLNYEVIFTSGASEANSFILQSVVNSYWKYKQQIPHIITSTVEHKSVLLCCEHLVDQQIAEVTYVNVNKDGKLNMNEYKKSFKPNTALVCIMHANNETGAINDIEEIGKIAHKHNVPFYSDTTQSFGKYPRMTKELDAFCISAHKINGPPGIGAIVIKPEFVAGYGLKSIIFGTQNNHLRGGTENIIGIAGMRHALIRTISKRITKNKLMCSLKTYLLKSLARNFKVFRYGTNHPTPDGVFIVTFSGNDDTYLCNTILLSFVKLSHKPLCNQEIKQTLEKHGIIVGIGSACNTNSKYASHVIDALGVDEITRKGVIRISLHEHTTKKDIDKFVDVVKKIFNLHHL